MIEYLTLLGEKQHSVTLSSLNKVTHPVYINLS